MIPVLLIVVPLVAGLVSFFFRNEKAPKAWALVSSLAVLAVSILGLTVLKGDKYLAYQADWMQPIGSSFSVKLDGLGQILCLLTAVSYPIIFLATWNSDYKKANSFFALMLLTQAGLMGVFLATDALLFYFFWELALIPVYFLCSQWGGEKRIAVTFKFFVYTFLGSVLMLVAILYVYAHTPDRSFSMESFYKSAIATDSQSWVFWLFFIAFAIKMPVFPFHSWQPDTYEQSPTATTMVLSGLMVKMGLFGLLRWLVPLLPFSANNWATVISSLSVIGIIYASLIAIRQDDIKRLIAYSSIAHIGLMCLAIFANTTIGTQGVLIQMFNHGINIIGLWIVVEIIERQFGTRKMSELGGLAQKAPALAIFFVIIAFANIALPLTNAFVGEFMMFNGVFDSKAYDGNYVLFGGLAKMDAKNFSLVYTVFAGLGIIFAAVYTLNMLKKVLFGNMSAVVEKATDIRLMEKLALGIIVILIFWAGVYPKPFLDITGNFVGDFIKKTDILQYITK
jgi:NADH-quinone oxidoreductase subunit M